VALPSPNTVSSLLWLSGCQSRNRCASRAQVSQLASQQRMPRHCTVSTKLSNQHTRPVAAGHARRARAHRELHAVKVGLQAGAVGEVL
jgi:hypothetical protein